MTSPVAPQSCSVQHEQAGTSAFGTAPVARFWVVLEQSGPWGRVAATESRLPVEIGRALDEACSAAGGRLSLARSPSSHADRQVGPRRAWLASAGPTGWLLGGQIDSAATLLDVDFGALARGDVESVRASAPWAAPEPPILLVCTNGRRDVCCAARGRPVARAGHAAYPGRVWEASHTGGHRFAPTGVLLPHGRMLGRLDLADPAAVVRAADAGQLPEHLLGLVHDRGCTAYSSLAQTAESAVRAASGRLGLSALRVVDLVVHDAERASATVDDAETSWRVELTRASLPPLPASCGGAPEPVTTWLVRTLAETEESASGAPADG
ncbi:MAG TPA: sucrase ferredoxin [Dermatophilaceae bacterium]|nr:sucrase ferredoxin [Dermatophilaceae bacterium]